MVHQQTSRQSLKNALVTALSGATLLAAPAAYADSSSITNNKGYIFPANVMIPSKPKSLTQQNFRAATAQGPVVGIDNHNNGYFDFTIENLTIGKTYAAIRKYGLANDPFNNNWTIISEPFVAESEGVYFENLAFSGDSRFLRSVNFTDYNGPSIKINSPRSNARVGGDVSLDVQVDDILPGSLLEVHVNDTIVANVESGPSTFSIPSYLFPNGTNRVYVRAVNKGVRVGDEVLQFEQWAELPLVFTNQVRLNNYQFQFTPRGTTTFDFTAIPNRQYTFKVSDLEGTLLYAQDITAPANGRMPVQYNFTKNDGSSLGVGPYAFELEQTPAQFQAAAMVPPGYKVRMTNVIDAGVTVGETIFVSHQWPNRDIGLATKDTMVALTEMFFFAANFAFETVGPFRDPYQGQQGNIYLTANSQNSAAVQAAAKAQLDSALRYIFSGAFVYQGHAGGDGIVDGADNFMKILYTTRDMRLALGNNRGHNLNVGYWWSFQKRLHENAVLGCSSTSGSWAEAGGLVPGVPQLRNRDMDHNMFTGFNNLSYSDATGNNYTWNIHSGWLIPDYDWTIASSINSALLLNPEVRDWGPVLYGDPTLTWANARGLQQ